MEPRVFAMCTGENMKHRCTSVVEDLHVSSVCSVCVCVSFVVSVCVCVGDVDKSSSRRLSFVS